MGRGTRRPSTTTPVRSVARASYRNGWAHPIDRAGRIAGSRSRILPRRRCAARPSRIGANADAPLPATLDDRRKQQRLLHRARRQRVGARLCLAHMMGALRPDLGKNSLLCDAHHHLRWRISPILFVLGPIGRRPHPPTPQPSGREVLSLQATTQAPQASAWGCFFATTRPPHRGGLRVIRCSNYERSGSE